MQALHKIEILPEDDYLYGVINTDDGESAVVLEFDSVPLEVELDGMLDLFDDDTSIEGLEQQYHIDLSKYKLIPADWL